MNSPLPPPIKTKDFASLRNCPRRLVPARCKELLIPLRAYLNQTPGFREVQEKRQRWRQRRQVKKAFGEFRYKDNGWEIYHHGGKKEVQLNVGMFAARFRFGMGFDFGLDDRGGSEMVAISYAYLSGVIRENPEEFAGFMLENHLSLEFIDYTTRYFKIVPTEEAAQFFLNLPKNQNPRWLFLGRILTPERDREILEAPAQLHREFEKVFNWIMPYWEDANRYVGTL